MPRHVLGSGSHVKPKFAGCSVETILGMPQPAPKQFSGIFICYRRDDSAGYARALHDRLSAHFGDKQIFMDIEQIEPGEDFVQVIEEAVSSCDVLVAIIGRSWLTSQDETGRRLDNINDFVRVEIAAAFARDIRVIPVLVQGARMPRSQDLPEGVQPLSRRQAFDLSDQRWQHDVNRLIDMLEKTLARQREARLIAAQEEAERRRREREEEEARRREAEEEERRQKAEAQRKASEEQSRRAEVMRREARALHERKTVTSPPVEKIPDDATRRETSPDVLTADNFKGRRHAWQTAMAVLALILPVAVVLWWQFISGSTVAVNSGDGDQRRGGQQANQTPDGTATPVPTQETSQTPVPPPGMVYVPGGTFTMGSNDDDQYASPAHPETVGPFFIDKYEVTNEEYAGFVAAKSWPPPSTWNRKTTYPPGAARKPVTGVTWDDAVAYAKWVGKRLPTEQEWEFAARGKDGLSYPWGNDWRAAAANADRASQSMADVGTYKGESPFGALDMAGNAWEWTASELTPYPGARWKPPAPNLRVIRGGSYLSNQRQVMTTYRRGWPAREGRHYSETGFRCADNE